MRARPPRRRSFQISCCPPVACANRMSRLLSEAGRFSLNFGRSSGWTAACQSVPLASSADARVVLPPLVYELVRAVGELAPGDRRDGVENGSPVGGVGFALRIRGAHGLPTTLVRIRHRV